MGEMFDTIEDVFVFIAHWIPFLILVGATMFTILLIAGFVEISYNFDMVWRG